METLRQNIASNAQSCDIIIADDALLQFSSVAQALSAKGARALLYAEDTLLDEHVAEIEKTCIGAGYKTKLVQKHAERSLAGLTEVLSVAEKLALTKDDLFVGIGSTTHLETLAYAAGSWCGGTPYVAFPSELSSIISLPSNPFALTAKMHALVKPTFRVDACLVDPNLMQGDDTLSVSVLATQAALGDGLDALGEVARLLVEANPFELAIQAARWAGRISSAANASLRGGLLYGSEFARALLHLKPNLSYERALAEGMRFSVRLAVSVLECDLELVTLQDALLEEVGAELISSPGSSEELYEAFLDEMYLRQRRLLVALPFCAGRIRRVPVEKDMIKEHINAWTESRLEMAKHGQ